jgi:hypothetical protein
MTDLRKTLDGMGTVSAVLMAIGLVSFVSLGVITVHSDGVQQGREEALASICEAGSQAARGLEGSHCICPTETTHAPEGAP